MSIPVNSIKVVGTSFGVRQFRIEALEEGAKVLFIPEPNNSYDPLAIAVKTFDGEHLGYVGRNDPRREEIRSLISSGFVVARACKTGGFKKWDGSKASYGLVVQYYGIDPFAVGDPGDKDEEEIAAAKPRSGKHPTNRHELEAKHKVKEFKRLLDWRMDSPKRREENKRRRQIFKAGGDIKPSYQHWVWNPYLTDEEVKDLFNCRKCRKSA